MTRKASERNRSGRLRAAAAALPLIVFLLLSPSPARPQDGEASGAAGTTGPAAPGNGILVLTLDEALGIAAARNRDIARAREFRRQVEGRYVEERAAALPQADIGASAVRSRDESQEAFLPGLGATIGTRSLQAGVSQPLFTWGKIGAGIRAAKKAFGTAEAQLALARQGAARAVRIVFHDVLLARELHDIAVDTLRQRERHLDEARRRLEAGTATDYDVLAAEVAVENARPEVIRSENLIRTARQRLRFLLALDRDVDARGSLDISPGPYPEYDEALVAALANRPELAEIASRIGTAGELITVAAAGNKPRLDLQAAYGYRTLSVDSLEGEGPAWSAGLFVSWPFFTGHRTRGQVAQRRSDVRALRIEEAQIVDAVALETRTAVDALQEAGAIVEGLRGTVAQAERLLGLAEKGFEFGVMTRLDVEDAESNLVRARGGLVRARRDYLAALADLDYATGTAALPETPDGALFEPALSAPGLVLEVLKGEPELGK
jgi:hydrophobic/amphiphilic exporter-1 (mainly G- bacteria), HAE1 family